MTKKASACLPAQKTIMRADFAVPHEIEEILELLPPQVTLNIPACTGLVGARATR